MAPASGPLCFSKGAPFNANGAITLNHNPLKAKYYGITAYAHVVTTVSRYVNTMPSSRDMVKTE